MALTLQFVPYNEIEDLSSLGRIKKLLKMAKENKIVLLEGRLKKEEEAELIKTTMEEIDDEFKGIELGVIYPGKGDGDLMKKLKANLANVLLGDRVGLTIIGPASIVKEIKKDPDKIQLLMKTEPRRR
ncbi:hypothetical protein COV19_03810 [Candidatus Woesearchaeota archaeon CG10_big_fil_rev_8_21_14_0_10_44_13]|nr:MAG: hypothetical protein COV19_03810 [Candidatus Woesearchaeota archaeon CG10_big_fil_rev_8_21_14_0_10_44_13]